MNHKCTRIDSKEKSRTFRKTINAQWIKYAEEIRLEGIENFENPMLALVSRVMLDQMETE